MIENPIRLVRVQRLKLSENTLVQYEIVGRFAGCNHKNRGYIRMSAMRIFIRDSAT